MSRDRGPAGRHRQVRRRSLPGQRVTSVRRGSHAPIMACRVYQTLCRVSLTRCLVALTVLAVGRTSAAGRRNGVRRARLLAELTQAQLAEAVGVTRQTIVAI